MKIVSKICILFSVPIFFWLTVLMADADTIVLKDGGKVEAETYWTEGHTFKFQQYGAIVGIPLEKVDRIEKSEATVDDNVVNFGFDLWKMGTSIAEVMDIAERNDIPLGRSGLVHANKHFNAKICRPYINTHSTFEYSQQILGYPTKVILTFTPETRALGLIVVQLSINSNNPGQNPRDDVINMLQQKYGKPYRIPGDMISNANLEWRVDGGNTIQLVSYSALTKLTYRNTQWYSQLESEKQQQADLEKQRNFIKDVGKF